MSTPVINFCDTSGWKQAQNTGFTLYYVLSSDYTDNLCDSRRRFEASLPRKCYVMLSRAFKLRYLSTLVCPMYTYMMYE